MDDLRTDFHTPSPLERAVMRRVRTVHAARLSGGVLLALAFFALSLWGIGREVFVAQVLRNMPSPTHVLAALRFFADAFLTTTGAVQLLSSLALVAFFWLLERSVRSLHSFARFA